MPFPNKDTQFSGDFAVEAQKKAAESRKKNNDLKKTLAELIKDEWAEPIKVNGQDLTKKQFAAIRLIRMINNPATGDRDFIKALEFARDTIGEKPIEKVMMSDIDPDIIKEVEKAVLED